MINYQDGSYEGAIAIIGMNGRFPGAKDMDEFWNNLYNGVESVKFFNREELLKMGIDEHLLDNPRFVAADAILDDIDKFDAEFFDYSAREAEIMDPQHRLFLESAWEVLESAGYNSELYDGRIAVYAGANLSGYMVRNLYSNPKLVENLGSFKIMIANSQDFLATRVSYKMNLTGPSVNVNTFAHPPWLHYTLHVKTSRITDAI
ncbi:beta-ketoacyl synthase N-terminal-like domain-containing protein [Acetivibrio straminisolvens]|uniref:Malonyl CoA-acyl carrier protein transacylase n=1 Tax=Acetivibrio straminisolvens JCM 21531 TaxID=1294263 RepID=W4UZL6_9FIRM|nr:malonyl CoA-acyl carrier protein transacylase [Acetivibrio straminisolvens JCM 21531]